MAVYDPRYWTWQRYQQRGVSGRRALDHGVVCACPRCTASRALEGRSSDKPRLQRETETVPILAHRALYVSMNDPRRPFHAVNYGYGSFGREARAECMTLQQDLLLDAQMRGRYSELLRWRRSHGSVPDPDCSCGFYSRAQGQMPVHGTRYLLQAQVELAGRVIIHTLGYRAEWQRVLQLSVPACPGCGRRCREYQRCGVTALVTAAIPARSCCQMVSGGSPIGELEEWTGVPIICEGAP